MEQEATFNEIDPNHTWRLDVNIAPGARAAAHSALDEYLCPSDSQPRKGISIHFRTPVAGAGSVDLGKSNYVISESIAGYDYHTGQIRSHAAHPLSDIIDGTSVTMMVGERDEQYSIGGTWVGRDRTTSSVGFRSTHPINMQCKKLHPSNDNHCWGGGAGQCGRYALGSLHPGGVNVVFCDGAVHFLSNDVEAVQAASCGGGVGAHYPTNNTVYQNLFNRMDGNPVDMPGG
jgi:prepilin-type processing-associated H-X9-DG protein